MKKKKKKKKVEEEKERKGEKERKERKKKRKIGGNFSRPEKKKKKIKISVLDLRYSWGWRSAAEDKTNCIISIFFKKKKERSYHGYQNYPPTNFKAILRPLQPTYQDKTHTTMLPR